MTILKACSYSPSIIYTASQKKNGSLSSSVILGSKAQHRSTSSLPTSFLPTATTSNPPLLPTTTSPRHLLIKRNGRHHASVKMTRLQTLLSTLSALEIPPQGTTLLAFTLFPNLAPEIRNMIWVLAASEPRTIKLFGTDGPADPAHTSTITGQTKHPGMVHACRESREVAMMFYERCSTVVRATGRINVRNSVYVNFTIDTFLFQVPSDLDAGYSPVSPLNFTPGHIEKIQHIEVESSSYKDVTNRWMHRIIWILLENAKVSRIRFTFIDWLRAYCHSSVLECLEIHQLQRYYVKLGLKEPDSPPLLEFHWMTTGHMGLLDWGDTKAAEETLPGRF